jgi:hypothetical protein
MIAYISGIQGGDDDVDDLWLIGFGGSAADMVPIGILAVFVDVEIHIMGVVIHCGVLSGVKRSPVIAEFEGNGLAEKI